MATESFEPWLEDTDLVLRPHFHAQEPGLLSIRRQQLVGLSAAISDGRKLIWDHEAC